MFYLKCSCCQQRTQQTSTLAIKVTARIFLLALPWLLALVQFYCMSQTAQHVLCTHVAHVAQHDPAVCPHSLANALLAEQSWHPQLSPVCLGSRMESPLGCASCSGSPQIQSGADAVPRARAVPCVHPRSAGAGGGLVPSYRLAEGGYGGFTFPTGQMFACFSPKHLLTCSIFGKRWTLRARLRLQEVVNLMLSEAIMGFLAVLGLRPMEEMCGEDVFYLKDASTSLEKS